MAPDFFVTGSAGGLGKFLKEALDANGFERKDAFDSLKERVFSARNATLIHCAFNSLRPNSSEMLVRQFDDNIKFTEKLLELPFQNIIFISSIDVYPRSLEKYTEEFAHFNTDELPLYGIHKLVCEEKIKSKTERHLILRTSALLGANWPTSLDKMMASEQQPLSVTSNSTFNYVLYEEIRDFILVTIENQIFGTFNIASSENVSLSEISRRANLKGIQFGEYNYTTGRINNTKAATYLPSLLGTSLDKALTYIGKKQLHQV